VRVLLFPFTVMWKLVGFTIKMTGRLAAIILGLILMIVGVVLSFTVVGAVIGIPLVLLGFTMMIRGFF